MSSLVREAQLRLPDAGQWQYVGEGNKNIVFAYQRSDEHFTGGLLRLRKTELKSLGGRAEHDTLDDILFAQNIIRPLVNIEGNSNYIPLMTPVNLDRQFLEEMSVAAQPHRPESRLHQVLDIEQKIGILTANMAPVEGDLHEFAVEIKASKGSMVPRLH
ncbi:hypothetical protein EV182_005794 [Spiromyces aspiralis]|uniref:Uncharacterized protein n=1 Tax=Spiromyces aspiralis TaxID=68401 RepID=A0ACC1HGU1_9FUNG|nr:hypothetical protein EV182_005794 [Spiromyces aspiralis]